MSGTEFSVADVLWGTALGSTMKFGLVARTPVIDAYVARANAPPAVARVTALDAELAAALARQVTVAACGRSHLRACTRRTCG